MLNQLDPLTVLTKFNKIAAASKRVVATDIPASDLNTMLDLALKAKKLPVSSVALVPPLIYPGKPDLALVAQRGRGQDRGRRGGRRARRQPRGNRSADARQQPSPRRRR